MNDEAVHPWGSTAGQRTTTNYALGGRNEFGQRVPPKPVHNLHGVAMPRSAVPDVRELVAEFHRREGRKPSVLHLPGERRSERFHGFIHPDLGWIGLDIEYGAEQVHVR